MRFFSNKQKLEEEKKRLTQLEGSEMGMKLKHDLVWKKTIAKVTFCFYVFVFEFCVFVILKIVNTSSLTNTNINTKHKHKT
jgi:hypothetical protein